MSTHLGAISARSRRDLGQVVEAAASAGSESLTLQPGELVYEQGDLAGAFYVIESGEVMPRSRRDHAEITPRSRSTSLIRVRCDLTEI